MSLRVAVATPFKHHGGTRIGEGEFVVALSLDRGWFSPDQAKRLVDIASGEGLLAREDGDLVATFDVDSVTIPDDFQPDESLFRERTPFERVLDALTDAGVEKRDAVAGINRLQERLGVTSEAAAVVYAADRGIDVSDIAPAVRADILETSDD